MRPSQYGIEPVRIDDRTIEFTIPSYEKRKLSVEYDSDRFHNLHILPEKPDPQRPDPENLPSNVIYYGPGVWNPEWITLRDNQTLYIDEGAVVYAKITSIGDNTAIKGRGVLSGARLAHTGNVYASGYQMIETNASKTGTRNGFTVEGITVVDSPSWTFSIYRTNNVRIENTNIICWILNGDGIDFCSVDGGLIKGCFIRTTSSGQTLPGASLWARRAGQPAEGESTMSRFQAAPSWITRPKTAITPPTTGEGSASASTLRAAPLPAPFRTSLSTTS